MKLVFLDNGMKYMVSDFIAEYLKKSGFKIEDLEDEDIR